MASEFGAGEGLSGLPWYLEPWPLSALAALGLGLALAQGLRALLALGHGEEVRGRRSTLAALSLSLALASGAALVAGPAQTRLAAGGLAPWALAWVLAGLASGFFPRGLGLPLLALSGLAAGLALTLILPLSPAPAGAVLARALPSGLGEGAVRIRLSGALAARQGPEPSFELPREPYRLLVDVAEFSGPFAQVFGQRRARLSALGYGSKMLPIDAKPATTLLDLPLFKAAHAAGGLNLPWFRSRRLASGARLPEPLVERAWALDAAGNLVEAGRQLSEDLP